MQRAERDALGSRLDGWKQGTAVIGDQNTDCRSRRLLQKFKQTVGGLHRHFVRSLYNINLRVNSFGPVGKNTLQLTDLIDLNACPVGLQ
ncbi:hypothetical protein D3C75_1058750 [compost metagenome]